MTVSSVLVCAGHDPSGGAGVQADIEAVAAAGGHAAPVITVLTNQDTRDVVATTAIEPAFFRQCVDTVWADLTCAAIKTGVLGDAEQIEHLCALKTAHPTIPLVVDPVLVAAGGARLADAPLARAMRERLFPLADLITPNIGEARTLCDGRDDVAACGAELAALGPHVLVTGGDGDRQGDGDGPVAVDRLFAPSGETQDWHSARLPGGPFHGAGCTLASAIAARLASGQALVPAIAEAQDYVYRALKQARAVGHGQPIPTRIAP